MSDEPNVALTLRLKPDRRQIARLGMRRHTDRIPAALWIRIADALNRLQEATENAKAQRSRAAALRTRARELSVQLQSIAEGRASGDARPTQP
jgi:hypothetical protein